MTKKIFKSILLVSFATLLACVVLIIGLLYNFFGDSILSELKSEAAFIAAGVESEGQEYLDRLDISNRVSWIDGGGNVIYDTQVDIGALDNHKDRQEIADALATGEGSSERFSDSVSRKTVNYALRLSDGSVIRVSSEQYTYFALLLSVLYPMILVAVLILACSVLLAIFLSKKIVKPINDIDLENPDINEDYVEISTLLHKITRQNQLIDRQMSDLRRRQEEFRAITENMSEGFLLIDNKAEVLSYNSSALKLLGNDNAADGINVMSLNRSEAFLSAVNQALSGEHCETVMTEGQRVYQLFANPVVVEGVLSGAVIVILDSTEKEKREEMRREFTSNVSHELKTPLTSISGISEMLMNGLISNEDIPKFAKNIYDESGRLIELINDIIELSRLDENAAPVMNEKIDLLEAAKQVKERLSSLAADRSITIGVSGTSAVISGSESIVNEIIYNLCDNAIKYNKEGGRVDITVSEDSRGKRISVKDTGIGIPKEHIDRIFERFYRVDKSHSKEIGGTGLGLSIVKHGADYHHAEISVTSKVDAGTEISVFFPDRQ